jgi:hypothetical protein
LLSAGFQSVADVLEVSARELASGASRPLPLLICRAAVRETDRGVRCGAEAGIGVQEAAAALEELQRGAPADPFGQSALDVLQVPAIDAVDGVRCAG